MVDHVSQAKRSSMMSAIHSHNNFSTDIAFKELLDQNGIVGWRTNAVDIIGKPDFVFDKEKIVVFIDGCFWHGCKKHKGIPKTNSVFWENKISNNIVRDKRVSRKLRRFGWHVLRIWEHDLKTNYEKVIRRLVKKIISNQIT
jgi:DNA mismatch endonuclease (patch repair protein)